MIQKPAIEKIPAYYHHYFSLNTEADLIAALESGMSETINLLNGVPEHKADYRYASDKWTIKEVVSHIIDTERVFAYRALRFSRKDSTPLEGFDENSWAPNANAASRTLTAMIAEFSAVRRSTIDLYSYMTDEMLDFEGTANSWNITARSIGWVSAGHNRHHCGILKERYL